MEIDNQDLCAAAYGTHAGIASTLVKAILGSYQAGRIAQNMLFEIYFVNFFQIEYIEQAGVILWQTFIPPEIGFLSVFLLRVRLSLEGREMTALIVT